MFHSREKYLKGDIKNRGFTNLVFFSAVALNLFCKSDFGIDFDNSLSSVIRPFFIDNVNK